MRKEGAEKEKEGKRYCTEKEQWSSVEVIGVVDIW